MEKIKRVNRHIILAVILTAAAIVLISVLILARQMGWAWAPWIPVFFSVKERKDHYKSRVVCSITQIEQLKKELQKLTGKNNYFSFYLDRALLAIKYNEIEESLGDVRHVSNLMFSLEIQPLTSISDIIELLLEAYRIQQLKGLKI